MTWIKVDDHIDEHPKFSAAGPLGMALWVAGMAYCNRNLTDGFIPWGIAQNLVLWDWLDEHGITRLYIGSHNKVDEEGGVASAYVIELLLRAGLWEQDGTGYRVHDFAE